MSRHPAVKAANEWSRTLHRWGAILIALPVAVVIGAGLLLQVKKQWSWVQPPTQRGAGGELLLSFDEILEAAKAEPRAGIETWKDVDRLDARPGRGVVKVRAANRWEVQIDTGTGEILQSAYRRSDLIESIHDGSFFGGWAKLWIFLPSGVVLFGLWATGIYLWVLPKWGKSQGRKRRVAATRGAAA